jgi:hypothetical protein
MLAGDPFMAHSMLSAAMNLGLLDPLEVVQSAEEAYRSGRVPLSSAEGLVRQIIGWRDFVWHLYWYFEPSYRGANELGATTAIPRWFAELDADTVEARCLADVLAGVRDRGWVHHIPRLMVLGNYAMQRGWRPGAMSDWFHQRLLRRLPLRPGGPRRRRCLPVHRGLLAVSGTQRGTAARQPPDAPPDPGPAPAGRPGRAGRAGARPRLPRALKFR